MQCATCSLSRDHEDLTGWDWVTIWQTRIGLGSKYDICCCSGFCLHAIEAALLREVRREHGFCLACHRPRLQAEQRHFVPAT